jgi:3-mercaptopyruvate sulfurtransferase SseA
LSNNSRPWALIGFIGLIVVGAALILSPLLNPAGLPAISTPIPTALTVDQNRLPYPDVPRVTVGDARAAHELKQAVLVDVRTAEQYAENHIPGAVSIPLSEFESRLNELNTDHWIITYCT